MPIYVYRCTECGEQFEKLFLSAAKAAEAICPACQSHEVEKQPALFGLGGTGLSLSSADDGCAPAVGGG